ncbi:MAG: M4 family metallopeptidase [Dermatophilaceae bacterium]
MNRLRTGLAFGALVAMVAASSQGVAAFGASPPSPNRAAGIAAEQSGSAAAGRALGLGSREKLVVKDVINDADGSTHVRYNRTFDGLRVIGGDLVSHRDKAGAVKSVSWNASPKLVVASTTPKVSLASAEAAGARNAALVQQTTTANTGELVVFAGGASAKATPKLAYDVLTVGFRADQTPSRLHTIVDANAGTTLESFDEVENGTGNGIYVGTVAIGTTAGTSYSMRDTVGNYTTDLNGSTSSTAAGTTFTDANDIWGNGAVTDRASAGVDAHYGAEKTFDYYKNVLGRNGIWNTGVGARSRVHYGTNYVNAFWDGTQMTYGDGASNTHPLVELDVAGHEMTHGVTENTAALVYTGDAGGLNEATSDIFGTAVEWYANNASDIPDYLIGELININGNGTPLRYMDQPSKDGASKDCWSSTLGSLDPHYSSGPLNHWFYLASEGSGAKVINGVSYNSPTCNASTVTPIGRAAAEKIWYRTLSTYLTSTSNYAAARDGAIKSAKDLYGAASAQCAGIESSFSAIAVPAGTETCTTTTPPPVGGNLLLNPGFESGAVSWTGTAGPITNSTGRPAHSGSWKMWLGGNGTTATETESQSVTIASTATAPKLSYWIRTDTAESGTTAYDTMKVQVVSGTTTSTLVTYSNVGTSSTYSQKTFDLSAYKGKTITVKFLMNEDSSLQTSFVVDDTAVTNS